MTMMIMMILPNIGDIIVYMTMVILSYENDCDLYDDYFPCYKLCNISALEHSFVEKTTPFSTISTIRPKGACTLRSLEIFSYLSFSGPMFFNF